VRRVKRVAIYIYTPLQSLSSWFARELDRGKEEKITAVTQLKRKRRHNIETLSIINLNSRHNWENK